MKRRASRKRKIKLNPAASPVEEVEEEVIEEEIEEEIEDIGDKNKGMENLKQPEPMIMEGQLDKNWKVFKSNFKIYSTATGIKAKSDEVQACTFLHCIGQEARDLYDTFEFKSDTEKMDLTVIMQKFDDHFVPQSNVSVERHKFNSRKQLPGESFQQFFAELRKTAKECDFGAIKDDMIRDHIVCGIEEKNTKDRLLRESSLTLKRAVEICKAAEESQKLMETMKEPSKIMMINNGQRTPANHSGKWVARKMEPHRGAADSRKSENKRQGPNMWQSSTRRSCGKCGMGHTYGNCPAFQKVCHKCKKKNHFARYCKNRFVSALENDSLENTMQSNLNIEVINTINTVKKHWVQELCFVDYDLSIVFKLDTGADINVLPINCITFLRNNNIIQHDDHIKITNYDGRPIKMLGYCYLRVMCKDRIETLKFYVVDANASAVLGIGTIKKLELLKRNDVGILEKVNLNIFNEYRDVFNGVGLIKNKTCAFKLKKNYQPSVATCRKVPFKMMQPLRLEVERLEKLKIIEKIDRPTEFVNPIVIVLKPDQTIRLCLDPKSLNKALVRERYELPTFEELTYKLKDSKYFSVLDANKGFWQIKLDSKSSDLTTFLTPFGRFKFLRLPFGLSVAPEIFHKIFNEMFSDIENLKIYIDDIIIFAETKEKHDEILKKVLQRARENGVVFNKSKCKIGVSRIKYIGHIFSEKGIELDPERIESIKNISPPKSAKELTRFLGMVTYLSKFIPNLSVLTKELRGLTKKNVIYNWSHLHQKEFEILKKVLTTTPVLQYYDENLPVRLSVDSSKYGMGAVIMQKGPIAYASKSLTPAQQNYAQIEKECLAIVFGCQRFKQYLFGKPVIIETDHKPLEHIFQKPLNKCPLRLQRLLLTLQNFDVTVKYTPGKNLFIADALSRTGVDTTFNVIEEDLESQINLINYYDINPQNFTEIKDETIKDVELQELGTMIEKGWPNNKQMVSDNIKPYWLYRSELVKVNELIYV